MLHPETRKISEPPRMVGSRGRRIDDDILGLKASLLDISCTLPNRSMRKYSMNNQLGYPSLPRSPLTLPRNPLSRTLASEATTTFLGSAMSLAESKIYTSTVSIPAYYTHQKHLEKGTAKDCLRKISGIPFAILYGFALYAILRYMILTEAHEHPTHDNSTIFDTNDNFCASNFTDRLANHSIRKKKRQSHVSEATHFTGQHREELVYTTLVVTVGLGTTSVFSRNTRTTMLLILPGIITSRSRTFLFTFVLGLLCNGPISSIRYNFDAILENAGCVYESALRLACTSSTQQNTVFKSFQSFVDKIKEKFRSISSSGMIRIDLDFNINSNLTFPKFKDLIDVPHMSEIKAQISSVIIKVTNVLKYIHFSGKLLTIISIILMIIDAVRYIRQYYSDSSFDNMFISERVRKMWKERTYPVLTPLRHWEVNEGYKVKNSPKCTRTEFIKSIRHLLPTFIFSVVAVLIIFTDIVLTEAIQYIKDNKDLMISFQGVHQNYTDDLVLDLDAYNISANACLLPPVYTSSNVYIVVCLVLLSAGISGILEVYLSRVRARMCDIFYPDKAKERADYLHYRITIGRINRRFQLVLIVRRELERRAKLTRFSPLARLQAYIAFKRTQVQENPWFICPACCWRVRLVNSKEVSFQLGDSVTRDRICNDCFLDCIGTEEQTKLLLKSEYDNSG